MTQTQLLDQLAQAGVSLQLEHGRLCTLAPHGAITEELAAHIRLYKEQLCDLLLRASQPPPLLPRNTAPGERTLPLSFGQEGIWFLEQLGSENAYTSTAFLPLRGHLDSNCLEQAFSEIIRRHESLRTTFRLVAGEAQQVIQPPGQFRLALVDLRHLSAPVQTQAIDREIASAANYQYDLTQDLMLRAQLLQLGPCPTDAAREVAESYLLLLTMHHIVSDGWSFDLLVQELATIYGALVQRKPLPYRDLPLQYADFARWQRTWLQNDVVAYQSQYWRQQLADAPTQLNLPTDYPHPIQKSYRGAAERVLVDAALTRQLHQLSRQANATLFMTLLAAFQVLLYRHTGQTDFLVGTTIAGRTHQSLERLIGFFVNILPLRADLAGDPPFLDLLTRVRQSTLAAYDHQALPFEQIVKQLAVERSLSRPSAIQVTFALQNRPLRAIEFPGLQAGRLEFAIQTSRFDLEFSFDEIGDKLEGCCTYNPDLFTDTTIKRLLGHFVVLLAGIIANPNQPVSQLPLLTPAEYHQIVYEWNNTAVDFGALQHMQALFEEQVARTPDAIAVVFGQEQLTYAELNAQANGLAHGLIEQGVGPEVLVVLYAERTPLFLAAILAIFKAGGAYLPLDPRAPAARIAQILSQSKAPFLLASHEFADGVAEALSAIAAPDRPRLLWLAEVQQQRHSLGNPPLRGDPANLAYVIYTSGSTGLPKGAMIEQRSMINHLYAMIADLALTNADAIAQTATQSFDISVWQFLTPLLIGGRVHIFAKEVATDPVLLLTQTERQKITVLEVVPSLLRLMLDAIAQGVKPTLANLRWLIPTGEALPPNLCRQWFAHYPSLPLFNAYGPTECADDVTLYPLFEPPAEAVRTIPIGYPVANMQVYILDHHLQPVPIGIPGELYIGGIGVGRGYLNDPERTSAAFIADPFTKSPSTRHTPHGPRLYKTGDMARYLPPAGRMPGSADAQLANIEFLGRQDYQVKIRGFRIELEDIEQALLTHESVQEAVVLARQDKPGELGVQLVAYFVGDADSATLQQHLAQRLPDYMLPAAFVALPAMPLTPHGKIDRRTLPAPTYASATRDLASAETLDEMRLLLVWQTVLGVQPIGVEDNFFELGGHSLLAPQLIYQMRQTLQRDFSLQQLFAAPTIRSLLRSVAQPQAAFTSFVPLRSGEQGNCGERASLFLIHAISGLVFPFTALLPYLAATQPVYALQARGIYDELTPFSSLEALAAATIQEMKTIQPHGPYAIAGWSFGGLVAFEIARQLASAGETIALLGIIDAYPGLSAQAMAQALATPQAQLHAFVDLLLNAIGGDQPSLPKELFGKALTHAQPVEWLLAQINQQRPWLALDPAIMKRIWRTLKHNGQLLQTYQPQPYTGMITLFCAEASAPADGIQRWQALTTHPVQQVWVNGEHNTMLNAPQVEKLGRELEKRMQGVMADVNQVIARG